MRLFGILKKLARCGMKDAVMRRGITGKVECGIRES